MNPVEIEEAVSQLASEPFNRAEFPFQFLLAFGNPETTIKRLRTGSTNQSDFPGGVLQRSNIHIATCARGEVDATLKVLRESPKTISAKAKFILATDGGEFQAEDVSSGETVACRYADFPDHFGFFLPLAGITTVAQVRESSFDIKATGRLNRLYVQLLKENPDWAKAERRPDMNHFMARLIFCFFAEDTDIFHGEGLFTRTVEQMSARDSSDTHVVIGEIFRAMDTKLSDRESAKLPRYANQFPYVNGQLFSGSTDTPRFSKIARSYLLHIGSLQWQKINPDIFGSMIQAVADDEERGALGMHYTSVPNILKVLNPLFLDDLRAKLEEANDNSRKLLNLRNRMARIRVFDPACGSGNFLVIAYKEMRALEAEINRRRGEPDRRSDIRLTNFRGIELRDFPAEVARLALIIAEYQADVLYRGQQEALAEFLPLNSENWITCGNALRLDWLSVCPPTATAVKLRSDDLFETPLNQAEIDFENEGGETYLCGNPPYSGAREQSPEQKNDLKAVAERFTSSWASLDYVGGWFLKGALHSSATGSSFAFVATNSICQGQQVPILWPALFRVGVSISFAHTSFKWANLASRNAGVTVIIVGITSQPSTPAIYVEAEGEVSARKVESINGYLVAGPNVFVEATKQSLSRLANMDRGNAPVDGGAFTRYAVEIGAKHPECKPFLKRAVGGDEFINGLQRHIVYFPRGVELGADLRVLFSHVLESVREFRLASKKDATRRLANTPEHYAEERISKGRRIFVPQIFSELREYVTAGYLSDDDLVLAPHFSIEGGSLVEFAVISSKAHHVWVEAVCGKLETRIRYSSTLGWNTFPVPKLTEQNRSELTRCAENILLAREAHFPATIADLYDPDDMPEDLRRAHDANDEVLERIYIGRRFRNDSERLEKLFDLYTRLSKSKAAQAA